MKRKKPIRNFQERFENCFLSIFLLALVMEIMRNKKFRYVCEEHKFGTDDVWEYIWHLCGVKNK